MTAAPLPAPTRDLAQAILGIWSLQTREDLDDSGQRRTDPGLGADPLGMLCFAPGHFAAQFMKRDRSSAPGAGDLPPALNNSGAVAGYDAYFGTYELDRDAGTITTLLEASISPANIGAKFVRDVRVIGNELIIRLATAAPDGTPVTRTLRWTRLL
jgi:hypothetical protein